MSLLFEYRAIFRTLAARQVPAGCSSSPVICWVDVVLARISSLVDHPDCFFPHLPSLQKQREDDTLRAATQLPGSRFPAGSNLERSETRAQCLGSKHQLGLLLKMPLLLLAGCPFASLSWYTFCVLLDPECPSYQRKRGMDVQLCWIGQGSHVPLAQQYSPLWTRTSSDSPPHRGRGWRENHLPCPMRRQG